jgi:hypothetical protein
MQNICIGREDNLISLHTRHARQNKNNIYKLTNYLQLLPNPQTKTATRKTAMRTKKIYMTSNYLPSEEI